MNTVAYKLFIVFALLLTAGYFWGAYMNRMIARMTFQKIESVLYPSQKSYVNIGGVIGYHASYKVSGLGVAGIECSLVLLPRQSLLWLPFSLLIFKHDRIRLTFITEKKVFGRAYVYKKRQFFPDHKREEPGCISQNMTFPWGMFALIYRGGEQGKKCHHVFESRITGSCLKEAFWEESRAEYVLARRGKDIQEAVREIYSSILESISASGQ